MLEFRQPGMTSDIADVQRQFSVIDFEALLLRQPSSEAALKVRIALYAFVLMAYISIAEAWFP